MDASAKWKKAHRFTHTILLRAPEEAVMQAIMAARGESATGACRVALLGYAQVEALHAELAAAQAEAETLRADLAAAQAALAASQADVEALRTQAVRPWWRRIFQK